MSELTTIYMPLLNEGTDVWRPVSAERLGIDTFCVIGPQPDDEKWMFAPGAKVRTATRKFSGGEERTVILALSD